jgi:hypothetical protein
MPPRKLRVLEGELPLVVGVCELCDIQFKSSAPDPKQGLEDMKAVFNAHTCKCGEIIQAAVTITRKPSGTE